MRTAPLTLSEVLEDEYRYFHEDVPPFTWRIEETDVREARTVVEKIRAIRDDAANRGSFPARFVLLADTCGPLAGNDHRKILAEAFNELLGDPGLFSKLLEDDVVAKRIRSEDVLALLARVPCARRVLLEDDRTAKKILKSDLVRSVFTRTTVGQQLWKDASRAVRYYPVLLAVTDREPVLEAWLLRRNKAKERIAALARLFTPPWLPRTGWRLLLPLRRAEPQPWLKALAADPRTLLRVLRLRARKATFQGPVKPNVVCDDLMKRFNMILLEVAYFDHVAAGHHARQLLKAFNAQNLAAVCLSGGGVRSATFNLGVLQGLADHGLLGRFHYVSTVSGGGYIGSWLSSWIRRHNQSFAGVTDDLCTPSADPRQPEVKPLQQLREYSSYLAPKASALAVDTWTLVATYLRNLLLNWTILIPTLLAFLVIPRLVAALIRGGMESAHVPDLTVYWNPWIVEKLRALPFELPFPMTTFVLAGGASVFLALLAIIVMASIRPPSDRVMGPPPSMETIAKTRQRTRLWLFPLLGSATAFAIMWVSCPEQALIADYEAVHEGRPVALILGAIMAVTAGLGAVVAAWRRAVDIVGAPAWPKRKDRAAALAALRKRDFARLRGFLKQLAECASWRGRGLRYIAAVETWRSIFAALFSGFVGGLVLHVVFNAWFGLGDLRPSVSWPRLELYFCVAIPLFLLCFFIQATLMIGLATPSSNDYVREWWARAASWIFLAAVVYAVVSAAVIFVPVLLMETPWASVLAVVAGVVTWVLTRIEKKGDSLRVRSRKWRSAVLKVAALIVLVGVVGLLSLGTSRVLQTLQRPNVSTFESVPRDLTATLASALATRDRLETWPRHQYLVADLEKTTLLHLFVVSESTELALLLFAFGAAVVAGFMSFCIDVNDYSMHGMYRNRLVRAYLGASRWFRRPQPFTGFDPQDDVPMWMLRPHVLWMSSFVDFDAFAQRLLRKEELLKLLPDPVVQRLKRYAASREPESEVRNAPSSEDVQADMIRELNAVMLTMDLKHDLPASCSVAQLRRNRAYVDRLFRGLVHPAPDEGLKAAAPPAAASVRIPIAKSSRNLIVNDRRRTPVRVRPPLHIINATLNLVAGDNLAWRERKGDSFTISPLHCGNRRLGYRDAARYGDAIRLGTAMAISGAAVSPNMGAQSSPLLTFLMTFFNARLGWWLGSPGTGGSAAFEKDGPRHNLACLLAEAFGQTNDRGEFVFLSDGGHFDNLGMYEMVLRRCRYIVVSDASADRGYAFGDLANAVRKIRIDLGIPIDLEQTYIGPQENERHGRYCALGVIRYDAVDGRGAAPGHLLYIKPAVYADCPPDVRNYQKGSDGFPHESTADQFFSESQFESYRALGRHIIGQISDAGRAKPPRPWIARNIHSFFFQAQTYLANQKPPARNEKIEHVSDIVEWMQKSLD
jgi:Patatin-like phospholipase